MQKLTLLTDEPEYRVVTLDDEELVGRHGRIYAVENGVVIDKFEEIEDEYSGEAFSRFIHYQFCGYDGDLDDLAARGLQSMMLVVYESTSSTEQVVDEISENAVGRAIEYFEDNHLE